MTARSVSDFVPEIWSDHLIGSLEQQTSILDPLRPLPVLNDPVIMVCGHPWWLSWWDVTDVKPVRFVYYR